MSTLTVSEFRARFETDLSNVTLQMLIDDAESEIVDLVGGETVTRTLRGGLRYLFFDRPVGSIASVTERIGTADTVLSANDYEAWHGGRQLERLTTGDNPSVCWGGRITIVYAPVSDTAKRKRVAGDLVMLAIQFDATKSKRVGDFSEQKADYQAEREKILAGLVPATAIA